MKIIWAHNVPTDPLIYYLEVDDHRNEVRKIEILPDGKINYASLDEEIGTEILGVTTVPTINQIDEQENFHAYKITKNIFEDVWNKVKK